MLLILMAKYTDVDSLILGQSTAPLHLFIHELGLFLHLLGHTKYPVVQCKLTLTFLFFDGTIQQ